MFHTSKVGFPAQHLTWLLHNSLLQNLSWLFWNRLSTESCLIVCVWVFKELCDVPQGGKWHSNRRRIPQTLIFIALLPTVDLPISLGQSVWLLNYLPHGEQCLIYVWCFTLYVTGKSTLLDFIIPALRASRSLWWGIRQLSKPQACCLVTPALAEGCLLLSYNAAVLCSCNQSHTVLVQSAVETWGSTPALPHGQTVQPVPEPLHPPVCLTWRWLLCCTPLHSLCPVGKLLYTKLSTEGLSPY